MEVYTTFLDTNMTVKSIQDQRILTKAIKKNMGDEVGFWSPRSGSSFNYSDKIPKEQIIEVGSRIQSKFKEKSISHKIKEVVDAIRKEVLDMPSTFTNWPPDEIELLSNETNRPDLLVLFLKNLLSGSSFIILAPKLRVIKSIAHDIIYSVSNKKHRTMKHTLFPLCIKRKTGSKEMVQWVNRFGHGMSYDEVCYAETTLALNQTKNDLRKNFCPSIIQPLSCITFIWDNNDVNPECLTGITMHCVITQLVSSRESHSYPTPLPQSQRIRSFQSVPIALEPYISKKRFDPVPIQTLRIETEHKTMESRKTDFLWVLLQYQSYCTKTPQKISNWTGFNYQTSPDGDNSYHNVAYLPAIDKSPTQIDTVYELLNQSMMKASALGHDEADIVVDQAIYAKADEILMNPINIDKKKFIIIRMGAFHTSCIFLSIIGKRFGDAGLRDLIIESNIIGKGSVEKVINGKHYNNGTRIFKYIYDALVRLQIDQFQDWLADKNQHLVLPDFFLCISVQGR